MDVEVKMKPVSNELLVPKPEIKMRRAETGEPFEKVRVVADRRLLWTGNGKELASLTRFIDSETQKEVPSSEILEVLEHYNYKLLDSKANLVNEKDEGDFIEYYYIDEKGEEHVVRPFERTTVLDIPEQNWVPSTSIDAFLITSIYELFTDKKTDIVKLWEEAEKRLKEDTVGITTFSHGRGFQNYYALLVPAVQNGKFVWLLKLTGMKLTGMKVRLNHLADIPAKGKIPIREAPTLEILPPIQMVISPVKRKSEANNRAYLCCIIAFSACCSGVKSATLTMKAPFFTQTMTGRLSEIT
jgi:hypothetical protein